jgi:hypothetical protein
MATQFKNAINTGIGTTPVDVLQLDTGFRATIIGCNIANITDYDTVNISVFIYDAASTTAHYVKDIPVPPNTSLKLVTNGEKIIIPEECGLRIVSDTPNSIDTIISYVEIS